MNDYQKSKEQLIQEITELRQRVAELEARTFDMDNGQVDVKKYDKHLNTLVDVLPGRAVVLSEDGIYQEVIKHNYIDGNYQPDDVIGKSLYDVQNKDLADFCMQKIKEVLAGNTIQIFEYSFYDGLGNFVYYEGYVAPFQDANAKEQNVIWVSRDISKSKKAEIALQESESRLRTVVNTIPDRIVILDRNGQYLDVIKKHIETGNAQPDYSVIGKTLYDVQEKNFADFCVETIQKTIDTDELNKIEYDLINIDGQPVTYQGYIAPIYDPITNDKNVMWISRDITDLKTAENALRENQQKLQTVIDLLPDRAVVLDAEARYIEVIKQTTRTSLPEPDKVIGKTINEVISDEFAEMCLPVIREALVTQTTQIFEFDLINLNGERVFYETRIAPWLHDETDIPRVLVISRNITDRKLSELELANYRDHLEILVNARTAELEREIKERKQLEEEKIQQARLAAVGQLAAGIAHDFNNVMAIITLDSSLVLRSPTLSDSDRNRLDRIRKQANHAANLIEQIMDFSRRSVREPIILDLRILLSELINFLRRTIPEHIEIEFNYTASDFKVSADPTQLQQVITNLALNARDAITGQGKLTFNLSQLDTTQQSNLLPELSVGNWIQLDVSDTGEGISQDNLSNIFEPFFTTKEVGKGTGLGLAQVYGIVQQHDGVITVTSTIGQGTTFSINLPMIKDDIQPIEANSEPLLNHGRGEVILLVEDNDDLLEALSDCLVNLGYDVLTAKNGEEALATFDSNREHIQLVLSDVVMPQMDGIELAQGLMNYDPCPKIVMMSGFHQHESVTPEVEANVIAWLQKPIDITRFSEVITKALTE